MRRAKRNIHLECSDNQCQHSAHFACNRHVSCLPFNEGHRRRPRLLFMVNRRCYARDYYQYFRNVFRYVYGQLRSSHGCIYPECALAEHPGSTAYLPVADTCAAFPLTIRAISNRMVDYLWSDGSTDETLIINDFGLYSVTISNDCGDVSGQYELLRPNLEVSIKPKDAVADECSAVPLTLKATANQNVVFKWKNNSTMDTLRVTEPGTYAVTVTAGVCGTATASYEVLGPGPECCRPLFPNAFTPMATKTMTRLLRFC